MLASPFLGFVVVCFNNASMRELASYTKFISGVKEKLGVTSCGIFMLDAVF